MLRIDEPEVPGVSPDVMWHSGSKGGVYNRIVSRDPETHGLSLTMQLPPPRAPRLVTQHSRSQDLGRLSLGWAPPSLHFEQCGRG